MAKLKPRHTRCTPRALSAGRNDLAETKTSSISIFRKSLTTKEIGVLPTPSKNKASAAKEGQFLSKSAEADLVEKNRSGPPRKDFYLIGGAKRDRTADLLSARQALSQLSYSPIL